MPHVVLALYVLVSLLGCSMAARKILVVDDSRTIRIALRQILSQEGYEVILAGDGDEGLRLVVVEQPDLLIVDIQMPIVDGYTLCQSLKQMGKPWGELPVVFITSLESHALNLLGDQMGAYLKKPVRREALLEAVSCSLGSLAIGKPVC